MAKHQKTNPPLKEGDYVGLLSPIDGKIRVFGYVEKFLAGNIVEWRDERGWDIYRSPVSGLELIDVE